MRANRAILFGVFLGVFGAAGVPSADAEKKPKPITHKQPSPGKMGKQYCRNLFAKETETAVGELVAPLPVNGFKFGVGTEMIVSTDGGKVIEGTFLGRLVDVDYKTTSYMFEDYKGKKQYLIEADRAKILYQGKPVPDGQLQSIAETIEQRGETCATYAVENFLTQLVAAEVKGNGKLAEAFNTKLGHADVRQMANEYYTKTRGGGNFRPIFKEISQKYGLICKSIEAATTAKFLKTVGGILSQGFPVLLEFYIPQYMVTSDKQWVRTNKKFGEDRRFWPPRKKGQREGGGHALVAVEEFESASGRIKLLINDSDWPERPVEWDYDKYFTQRAASSGMVAHYCIEK